MESFKLQQNKQDKELPNLGNIKVKCPLCKEEIASNAVRCPKCTGDLSTEEAQKNIQEQVRIGNQAHKEVAIGAGIVGAIVVVIFLFFMFSGGDSNTPTSQQEEKATARQAFIISQGYVESILKSPASADFPSRDYNSVELGGGEWMIESYVDAQNSFGAQVRTEWSAVLTHTGGDWAKGSNWDLEKLIFGDEVVYP